MESVSPPFKCPKFPKSFNAVDAAADGDKFDELPEPVVHHIFSFMETILVMRASAVSTRWRYLWNSMPHLDFNYVSFRLRSSGEYEEYKDFINWVLMTHDESVSIESCRLTCLCKGGDNSVYRWLHFLAEKHVQKLYLNLDTENPFVLPWCLCASDSLKVLEIDLQYSVLKIPSCAGFSQLKSVKLASIVLLDQNSFQNFISSCPPLLENLSLNKCVFQDGKVLDISLRNLRKLVIEIEEYECDLKITCPNLVFFDLAGPVKSLSWGEKPCFLRTANLHFYLDKVNDEVTNFVLEILKGVCHVEILKLRWTILENNSAAVVKPGCFSTIFSNLKTLKLSTGVEACYIQSIIYLLKCAPNLQFLSVRLKYSKNKYECKMLDEDIECLTCHLKMVKLINVNGNDADLELVRFFLKNARVLEKMSITWCPLPSCDTKRWDTKREIIQKVIKFPIFSSRASFSFNEM